MFEMIPAGLTDTGKARTNNEDAFLIDGSLLIVADGMGGAAAGEIASSLAIKEISASMKGVAYTTDKEITDKFNLAILKADSAIKNRAKKNPELKGMGTTIMAALHLGDRVLIGYVGDSRAYLISQKNPGSSSSPLKTPKFDSTAATAMLKKITDDFKPSPEGKDTIRRITEDHSVVMDLVHSGVIVEDEIRMHPLRNRITRCVGNLVDLGPDFTWHTVSHGDILILCSDGLWEMVYEDLIFAIVRSSESPEEMCKRLVIAANDSGGADNITVIAALFMKMQ
jgi:protein phosphatase